jgi:hypothetical protein
MMPLLRSRIDAQSKRSLNFQVVTSRYAAAMKWQCNLS